MTHIRVLMVKVIRSKILDTYCWKDQYYMTMVWIWDVREKEDSKMTAKYLV